MRATPIGRAAEALDNNYNPDRYPVMAAMFVDYAHTALTAALDRDELAETIAVGYDGPGSAVTRYDYQAADALIAHLLGGAS